MNRAKSPKVLFFDIESTNLAATFGTILCIGYKWLGSKKVHVPTLFGSGGNHNLDDKPLVKEFAEVYAAADYAVAHYGRRFDVPMIKSKLLKYGLPPLAPTPLIDTWEIARRELRMHSNRLTTLAQFLETSNDKTPISFDDWLRGAQGDRKALKVIVEHCKRDVLVLEEVFLRLQPLSKEVPARQLFTRESPMICVSCGDGHIIRRGYAISLGGRYARYQCQKCGKWQRNRIRERVPGLKKGV